MAEAWRLYFTSFLTCHPLSNGSLACRFSGTVTHLLSKLYHPPGSQIDGGIYRSKGGGESPSTPTYQPHRSTGTRVSRRGLHLHLGPFSVTLSRQSIPVPTVVPGKRTCVHKHRKGLTIHCRPNRHADRRLAASAQLEFSVLTPRLRRGGRLL